MARLIIILLIAFGAVYIYTNQEDILNIVKQHISIDRTIYRLDQTKNKNFKFFGENLLYK